MTFLTILGVTEILCSFRLVLARKPSKEIRESFRLEVLEKFSAHNFALSDAEDSTSRPLNGGGIVDLALLGTLLVIHPSPKSFLPNFKKTLWPLFMSFNCLKARATLRRQFTFCH